jgi:hypothetical protein
MVSSSNAVMAYGADFILGFSFIQQTTLKSENYFYHVVGNLSTSLHNRILMASIRNMGGCPCPRCTIQKSRLHLVGTRKDRNDRIHLTRIDDHIHRYTISQAREVIYGKKYAAINSAGVERMLKPLSLVPTMVNLVIRV